MTRRELEVTDMNQIIDILDRSKVLHLGLVSIVSVIRVDVNEYTAKHRPAPMA